MTSDIPPGAMAQLDQIFAEADEKYTQLVGTLRELTEEHGIYGAMAIMGNSLGVAPKGALISVIVTGMYREMRDRKPDG